MILPETPEEKTVGEDVYRECLHGMQKMLDFAHNQLIIKDRRIDQMLEIILNNQKNG